MIDASGGPALMSDGESFDWSLCRTFLAVARRGSIAAATGELGISHPAVRRQLDRLELALGAPLFSRSQSGMALTPLAVALLEPAEDMERSARSMLREATSADATGLVRIAADGLMYEAVLPTMLLALRRDQPGLRFEVAVGSRDLLRREADVGIHLSPPTQERVVASRVATFRTGLFASRSWLAENGEPADARDLVSRATLVGRAADVDLRALLGPAPSGSFAIAIAEEAQVLPLVAMGLGIGMLPLAVAERHGGVERVLPDLGYDAAVWLSVHPDLRQVPHVRHVMDAARDLVPGLLT